MKLPHPRTALIGFRGVGKSVLAQELQKYFSALNISLDAYIENREQMTIAKIVQSKGWAYFREKETQSLRDLLDIAAEFILDTGGGVIESANGGKSEEKMVLLRKNFYCVYVTMQDDLLLERLQNLGTNTTRIALPASLEQTLQKRKPWYQELAHFTLDVSGLSVEESARKLTEGWQK